MGAAGGRPGPAPPPVMVPMPRTSATTAAAASTGVPARAQRRLRSSVPPRSRASPMSTRDGGCSVVLSLSSSARAPDSSMSGLLCSPGGSIPAQLQAGRAGAEGRSERLAQAGQCLGGLALDGPGRAAEDPRGLLYVQVAVEAEHQRGALARRQRQRATLVLRFYC